MALTPDLPATPIAAPAAPHIQPVSLRSRNWWLVLLVLWAASGIYAATLLKRGWVPHDEGTLGQSAERVLGGELPHDDFDEVYTGGLSYLNAGALLMFGDNLGSPRIVLYLFFLAWVPAVYWIASRFASATGSAAITLLAVAWSIPNYSAAIPSWYNLFLATFGAAALLHYLDKQRWYWLFTAGVCGGISFLFKLSGAYFVAAVLLFLVFREQTVSSVISGRRRYDAYSLVIIAGMLAFMAVLLLTFRHNATTVSFVEFFVPGAALAGLCIWREMKGIATPARGRWARLVRMLAPFLAGALLPVVVFLVPYFRAGALSDFIYGVFTLPARRFAFAARPPAGFGLYKIVSSLALVGLLALGYWARGRALLWRAGLVIALAVLFLISKTHAHAFAAIWAPLPLLAPIAVLAGILILNSRAISPLRQQELVLLLSVVALCSLIQFPFSAGIYFCYVAPLLALALLALFATRNNRSAFLPGVLVIFYLSFALFRVNPEILYVMGNYYQPQPHLARLTLARGGGLRVDPQEAAQYESLIPVIEEHAGESAFIYAAPDCPEVYFLSGKRNPTRTMFDFFDEPAGHSRRVLDAISSHQVNVIAILQQPPFSPPISPELENALHERFPESRQVGKFEVRWRE